MTRNKAPLTLAERVIDGSIRLVADWPLSGPGHYRLRLELDGAPVEEAEWTVEPTKLSTVAFRALLEDLNNRLPVSIALKLEQLGASTGGRLSPPTEGSSAAEEVTRLRRAILRTEDGPGLAAILEEIAKDPHEVLADKEVWVPSARARRVTPAALIRAAYAGANQTSSGLPQRLPDARVEPSVDVYENRLLKTFVDQVEGRLRRLRRFLASKDEAQLVVEVELLESVTQAARRQAAFLDSVGTLSHAPARVTMVLVKKHPYRKLLELVLDFRQRIHVSLDESALESPLEQLPELYEKWGTLVAIQAILELGVECGYVVSTQRIFGRGQLGAWIEVLPDGKPALELHHPALHSRISVVPQRVYSHGNSRLRSISFRQIPDLSIEVVDPTGTVELYLLDPKYKLDSESAAAVLIDGRPKKVDIDKMHAYRDSIRDADGGPVVRLAALLYPGKTRHFDDGLAALSAVPGATQLLSTEIKTLLRPAFRGPPTITPRASRRSAPSEV